MRIPANLAAEHAHEGREAGSSGNHHADPRILDADCVPDGERAGRDRAHIYAIAILEPPPQVRQRVLRLGLRDAPNVELDRAIGLGR